MGPDIGSIGYFSGIRIGIILSILFPIPIFLVNSRPPLKRTVTYQRVTEFDWIENMYK
jgi:hypothetical protein